MQGSSDSGFPVLYHHHPRKPTGQPAAAGQPAPVDGARHVHTYTPIAWLATNGSDGYNVYFGKSPTPPLVETVSVPAAGNGQDG